MFTKVELLDAINELCESKHSIQNCEKLAAVYTVLDHLFPEPVQTFERSYSMDNKVDTIKNYGESLFLTAVTDKDTKQVLLLVDELMTALQVLNPRLASNFFEKLNNL